jgi:hypothetical protein
MGFKTFFRKVGGFFKAIFSRKQLERLDSILQEIEKLTPLAFEAVQVVASMTPTRSDDEFLNVSKQFGLGPLDLTTKENALRDLARLLLQKQRRDAIRDSVANAAVELAVNALKAART